MIKILNIEPIFQNKQLKSAINAVVLVGRMRNLERTLQRHPHRNDIKLDVLKLRNQIKQLKKQSRN